MNYKTYASIALLALILGSVLALPLALAATSQDVRVSILVGKNQQKTGVIVRGDVNADGNVDIADLTQITEYFNRVRPTLTSMESADFNADTQLIWKDDAVGLANHLFYAGNPVVVGDVNTDGTVDITDISVLGQYLSNVYILDVDLDNADVNRDTVVNVADRIALQNTLFPGAQRKVVPIADITARERTRISDEDVATVLTDVKVKTPNVAYSFPLIQYTGYSDDNEGLKFVFFEKRSTSDPTAASVTVTNRYISGMIGLGDGTRYSLRGEDVAALEVYTQSSELVGKASFDFSASTLVLSLNGVEQTYTLIDVARSLVSETAHPSEGVSRGTVIQDVKVNERGSDVALEQRADVAEEKRSDVTTDASTTVRVPGQISFWARVKSFFRVWE